MGVMNNLLLFYYFIIIFVGYGSLIFFVIGYNPEGDDLISKTLRGATFGGSFSPRELIKGAVMSMDGATWATLLLNSFSVFFGVCVAGQDAM